MSTQICLKIPTGTEVPIEIKNFDENENYLMLKYGSYFVLQSRLTSTVNLRNEIKHDVNKEKAEEMKKLEKEIEVKNELIKYASDENIKLKKYFEELEIKKEKELKIFKEKLESDYLRREEALIKWNDNSVLLKNEISRLNGRSTAEIGQDGQTSFYDLCNETFVGFRDFNIKDTSTIAESGDFHLNFAEFHVLADVKNYNNKVNNIDIIKIKRDLGKNAHIHFAWLVSLKSGITKYDRSPIMIEFINSSQCLIYVNNVLSFSDPKQVLRIVWFVCESLVKFLVDDYENLNMLSREQEKSEFLLRTIKNGRQKLKEVKRCISSLESAVVELDLSLSQSLNEFSSKIDYTGVGILENWWSKNVKMTNTKGKVSSETFWIVFVAMNKDFVTSHNISISLFNEFIRNKVPEENLKERTRNKVVYYEMINVKLEKNALDEKKEINNLILEIENDEGSGTNCDLCKKYNFKKTFCENVKVMYVEEEKDINVISLALDCNERDVINCLCCHGIEKKLSGCRGYADYKKKGKGGK
jgi:hypothetical protein